MLRPISFILAAKTKPNMPADIVLNIAQSIDGKIATHNHSVEWLPEEMPGYDFESFLNSVTHIISGRNTYEFIKNWGGPWPYGGKKFYLFTSQGDYKPAHKEAEVITENPVSFCKNLKAETQGKIWLLGGSPLIASLLDAELIDELQIAVIAKLLGDGIPLTQTITQPSEWKLNSLQQLGEVGFISVYKR